MAGKPINLRRARKARARSEARRQADANAVAHGTPKDVRALDEARRQLSESRLDAHRRSLAELGDEGDDG